MWSCKLQITKMTTKIEAASTFKFNPKVTVSFPSGTFYFEYSY